MCHFYMCYYIDFEKMGPENLFWKIIKILRDVIEKCPKATDFEKQKINFLRKISILICTIVRPPI